jgi:hypothetical protein
LNVRQKIVNLEGQIVGMVVDFQKLSLTIKVNVLNTNQRRNYMSSKELNFDSLDVPTQKKIQEMRRCMAKDLGIEVKSKIPIDLYLAFAKAPLLSEIEIEGKKIIVTFALKGRAITILNTIKPNWEIEVNN